MALKSTEITIKGIAPLLMHAYPLLEMEAPQTKTKEELAEHAAYRDPETGRLYLPGVAVGRALISAAGDSKGKGRASLAMVAAAGLLVSPERIDLGAKSYIIDSRWAVIPATRGRVMRHRPRLDSWQASFTLEWDDALMSEKQARQIVDDCGARVGVLDFRPEKKGPFGRFVVTKWD